MSVQLYDHNQIAYEAARTMLAKTGKAAVIHPTGTGKSFVGFRLCEDYWEGTVCWLSPSEYIFRTQIENWKSAGAEEPENIRFFTYAKLMLMDEEELASAKFDLIILDEFHRCGAQMWGQGVRRLLEAFESTPVLGLSATNIRYLDNQRDMADELFDGNIASEMSLGEAIVRGILNPPKYVLSVYSYQKDLKRYEANVRAAKSRAVRDEAEKYLEALRRALEKADGLDEIFRRHMTDTAGKYIVFCANYEHMHEMMEKAPEWFQKVDAAPHLYSVYSDNPETSREFEEFKEDDSSHLKLLFCIDMLNEGIHVDGVSGVILLRPTVSPIIYKQQIGRALSAGKKQGAVIFDVVSNIENLYSIGAIEEEMQAAMMYYRASGNGGAVVHEHFRVIDEVRNCYEIFNKLNDTLAASWNMMYGAAERYYREHGDLEVPKRYVTEEGFSLGSWINTQRRVHAGKIGGILTEEQVDRLSSIGMRWKSAKDINWERSYGAARLYYERNGNLLVNISAKGENGVALGRWLAQLRDYKKNGIQSAYLTPERIRALDEIGMVWDVPDYLWETHYHAAVEYHREHGDLNVPSYYVDGDGVKLGAWIGSMRSARKRTENGDETDGIMENAGDAKTGKAGRHPEITPEQTARLDELGMVWENRSNVTWEKSYEAVCRYQKKYGNLDIPATYVTEDGCRIGRWIRHQREAYKTTLSAEKKRKLDAIGMVWEPDDPWDRKYELLERYYEEHGDTRMPADYVVDGIWLSRWLREQTARLNGKATGKSKTVKLLTEEQVQKLERVGITRSAGLFHDSNNIEFT